MELQDIIDEAATRRAEIHKDSPTSRPLTAGHEKVGLEGEFAFAEWAGLWPDLSDKPKGDGGVDFWLPCVLSVDVKTSRSGRWLMHPVGKKMADVFVLAIIDPITEKASLVGWEWGSKLAASEQSVSPHGVTNYQIARGDLRPMESLRRMTVRRL